ncbi:MAG: hypothetical protein CVV64_03295 [Candidatus Wallbacteria bacterium HGW-Wallbacteria-1]|jgi:competence ComEA-like helix-hairpin-helix protein|uniref:Helix-hairpin-helix DNA-binding motif class 1 domain-containing protein n=1 Tax=Candidatus Wallbacteria bacterium HGW-Wallbacteria-1 TaxID=2013854 RepID=A0A2N1PTU9_9BACT|nr:MAG: hypothetical protein CVV64_03295 [Candidatus Wallbacteria bacterium HGW-Wallbacteria-1]
MKRPGALLILVFLLALLSCLGGGYSLFRIESKASAETPARQVQEGRLMTTLQPRDITGQTYEVLQPMDPAKVEAFLDRVRSENSTLYTSGKKSGAKKGRKKKKGSAKAAAFTGVLDINTATAEMLSQIKGLGKKTAENIVKYRVDNGPYKKAEDIMKVKRIGQKLFDKIKDKIKVTD